MNPFFLRLASFLLIYCFSFSVIAQIDFNNYTPIQSEGKIPAEFTLEINDRIKQELKVDYDKISNRNKYKFVLKKSYQIDNLLHSGLIIYGDPISTYVKEVAKKILFDDSELFESLQFYTLKSNVANAFVTSEGMVFVTMGLISQLVTESDLAFILAHEISHHKEEHIIKGLVNKTDIAQKKTSFSKKIEELSDYSKDQELEADKEGTKLYLKAGYPAKNLNRVFDILMYSYLPTDELRTEKQFLVGEKIFLPDYLFPEKINSIKVDEDYDDSKSTHPNIQKRKEQIIKTISENKETNNSSDFKLGENRFNEVLSISRFERVYNYLYSFEYANALYEISVLERKYPNSTSLDILKANCWTNLAVFTVKARVKECFLKSRDLEGEIQTIHYFFGELKNEQIRVLALRNIIDLKKKYPNNETLKTMEKIVLKQCLIGGINWGEYYNLSFNEAIAESRKPIVYDTINPLISDNGIIDKESDEWKNLSKYEKIKLEEKALNNDEIKDIEIRVKQEIDSADFILYALYDYISTSEVLSIETKLYNKEEKLKKQERERVRKLSKKEKKKYDDEQESINMGLTSVLFVEPLAASYKVKSKRGLIFKHKKSTRLQQDLVEGIDEVSSRTDLDVILLSKHKMSELGTESYNHRAALERIFIQYSDIESKYYLPADLDILEEIKKTYKVNQVAFTYAENRLQPEYNMALIAGLYLTLIGIPIIGVYAGIKVILRNKVNITTVIFDLNTGSVSKSINHEFKQKPNKSLVKMHIYDLLIQLNTPK